MVFLCSFCLVLIWYLHLHVLTKEKARFVAAAADRKRAMYALVCKATCQWHVACWRFNARRVLLEELIFRGRKFNEDEEILAGICVWDGPKMEMGETVFGGWRIKTKRKDPFFRRLRGMFSNDRGLSPLRSCDQRSERLRWTGILKIGWKSAR